LTKKKQPKQTNKQSGCLKFEQRGVTQL